VAPDHRKTRSIRRRNDTIALTIVQVRFYRFQFGIVPALVVLGAVRDIHLDAMGSDFVARALFGFDLGREDSLPTAISAMNLLVASVLAFFLHRRENLLASPSLTTG
jgi:hypothetical protein